MSAPMGMIFGLFSDIYMRLPKSTTSKLLNYINLNVKNCLKLNGS